MMQQKKRAAAYCRIALPDVSAMNCQKEYLQCYALSQGYGDLAIYEDNGANGLTLDRPGFRLLEADIQAGKIDAVLVRDIARIGRNLPDVVGWMNELRRHGVRLVVAE